MRLFFPAAAVALTLLFPLPAPAATSGADAAADSLAAARDEVVAMVMAAALADSHAHRRLGDLCTLAGPRLDGSPGLERAVGWALRVMRGDGLDRVWADTVQVPLWIRGEERARVLAPREFDLPVLGFGPSVPTPPGGITAPVLAVASFDELDARADEAAGRIVLFEPPWQGYGSAYPYRSKGAIAAARCGAVACLVRSPTDHSLATLHTGVMRYAPGDSIPRIPAAAVTVEDAALLHEFCRRGLAPRVHLEMGGKSLPMASSANVIGEITGRELPDEIVLVGAHLDSWDVGTGAHDDGAGCVIALETARLMVALGLRPRRTVRIVLFTDEEIEQRGGEAYAHRHGAGPARHVAALECDSGGFAPAGFGVKADSTVIDAVLERVRELARPLAVVGADSVAAGWAGVDIAPLVDAGVPGLGHRVHGEDYFAYHHSAADTFDKVDARELAQSVAAVAGLIYALAEDPRDLGAP